MKELKKFEKTYYRLVYEIEKAQEDFEKDPQRSNFDIYYEKRTLLQEFCKRVIESLMEDKDDIFYLENYNTFIERIERENQKDQERYERILEDFRKKFQETLDKS